MTVRRKLNINLGLRTMKAPQNAYDPQFFSQMQAITKQLMADINLICDQFEEVTPEICYDALQPAYDKSQIYCPVATGALKESGYLEIVEFRGNPLVEVGYAKGGQPDYAVYVHENIEMQHKPPTQAKFLERAVNEEMGDIQLRIIQGYRDFMGV